MQCVAMRRCADGEPSGASRERAALLDHVVKRLGTLLVVRERLTSKGRERRDQLMRTAAALFAERGYHPTSVADIVGALGVGKGVFYWYFTSKEELLAEILRASHHDLRRR